MEGMFQNYQKLMDEKTRKLTETPQGPLKQDLQSVFSHSRCGGSEQ